jgi:hypothetical protein
LFWSNALRMKSVNLVIPIDRGPAAIRKAVKSKIVFHPLS